MNLQVPGALTPVIRYRRTMNISVGEQSVAVIQSNDMSRAYGHLNDPGP